MQKEIVFRVFFLLEVSYFLVQARIFVCSDIKFSVKPLRALSASGVTLLGHVFDSTVF